MSQPPTEPKVKTLTPPAWTITWDAILPLGVEDTYYRIDCWLDAEAVEAEILDRLVVERTRHDPRQLWRCVFIADLNSWNAAATAEHVTNRLDFRCFIRLHSLRYPGPTRFVLEGFVRRNAEHLDWSLRYLASIWSNSSALVHVDANQNRPRWVRSLDEWSRAVATTNREVRLPALFNRG